MRLNVPLKINFICPRWDTICLLQVRPERMSWMAERWLVWNTRHMSKWPSQSSPSCVQTSENDGHPWSISACTTGSGEAVRKQLVTCGAFLCSFGVERFTRILLNLISCYYRMFVFFKNVYWCIGLKKSKELRTKQQILNNTYSGITMLNIWMNEQIVKG